MSVMGRLTGWLQRRGATQHVRAEGPQDESTLWRSRMIAHRWQRIEQAALWECVPPDLGRTTPPDGCDGCGLLVTDEHFYGSFPPGEDGGSVPVSLWLDTLVAQSDEWWADRRMAPPAVGAIGRWPR